MKKCVACQKDIPDGAIHCVFCGAKQQPAGLNPMPSAGANQQKTIMGYAAADLAKFGIPMPGAAAPDPAPAAAPPAPVPPAGFGPPPAAAPPPAYAPPPAAAAPPPAYAPPAAAPPQQRTVMFGGGPAPAPMAGPPGFGGPATPVQPTSMMSGSTGGAPPPAQPHGAAPLQVQSPHVLSPGSSSAGVSPSTSQPRMAAQSRPTVVTDDAPVEPWGGSFRLWMVLVGLGLIATTVAPWAAGDGKLVFSWNLLTQEGQAQAFKIWPIVYGASGVLCLLLGLIPVPVGVRGIAGVLLGAAAVVLAFVVGPLPFATGAGVGGGGWQGYVALGGLILAPVGLLVSGQYPSAMFGRILAFLGGALLIVPWVVPDGGGLPIVNFFKSLGGGGGLRLATIWFAAYTLLPGLFALLCIAKPIIASFWAWLIILGPVVGHLLVTVIDPLANGASQGVIDGVLSQPITLLIAIPLLAFPLLLTYGLATLIGKTLEA